MEQIKRFYDLANELGRLVDESSQTRLVYIRGRLIKINNELDQMIKDTEKFEPIELRGYE